MNVNIYVKRLDTSEVVKTIPVDVPISERRQEMILMGLLRTVDTDRFYVDDSEIDTARGRKWEAK